MRWAGMLGVVVALSACISQKVTPVATAPASICIERNPAVWPGFLGALSTSIRTRGYHAIVVDPGTDAAAACPNRLVYTARQGLHWGPYLATADIRLLEGTTLLGRATYAAPYASMGKHGTIRDKVDRLIEQLLPPAR